MRFQNAIKCLHDIKMRKEEIDSIVFLDDFGVVFRRAEQNSTLVAKFGSLSILMNLSER